MIASKIEDKHITSFRVNDNIVADKKAVGSFVKNTAELQIINLNHFYDNLKEQYIDIQGFGKWYVNDLETDEEFTESTLKLNDITEKFDRNYENTFAFPDTMKNWAIWIGNQVGVPLKGDFLKSDLVLKERPYLGINPKFRDAVKFIAKITGNYAQKNYDNTYSIRWFDNTKADIEDWESFVHGNVSKSVNVIVLSTGNTEDNVKWPEQDPKEPYELRIEDDWTNIDRYELNEAIYNQVNGFNYVPISKLEVPFGLLELRAGQKIKTKDIETKDIETYISSITLEWQGGNFNDSKSWTSSIKMEELNETTTKLRYANSIRNKLLEVERKTDKNTGVIEDTITSLEETSKNLEDLRTPILTKEGNNHLCLEEAYETNAIEYNIIGKCEQIENLNPYEIKTIRGIKNLFNINHLEINDSLSVTSKIEKNALILTNSDNNANSYIRYKLFNTNEKERKTYTFSCYAKTNGNNLARVNIFYADENGNNRTEITNTIATKEGILKCTFTLDNSFNENQKNILILFYGSYNAGNLKDTLATYSNIQLEESSIAHSYVPYGSWLKSKVLSKNLANIANFNVSANHAWKNIFDVVDNIEYTLSFIKSRISDVPIVNNSINQIGEIRYYHNETLLSSIVIPLPYVTISSGSHKTIYPFVTPDKCNNIAIDFTNNNGDGNLNTMVSDIQLEENQEATEYESFQEKEIFVDINKPNLFNFLNIINKSNINANGEIVEDPSQAFDINFIKVIPKKKYKLVSDYERQFVLSFYKDLPKIGSVGTSRIVKNNIFTETVTVPEDYNYLAIRQGMDALTTEDNSKLKIYEGLDSYYELNSIKEVADSLEVNHGTLEKRIGKIILDGTTGTFTAPDNSNENFIQVNIQIPNIEFQCSSVGDEFLCTHFSYYEKATSTGKEREGLKLFNSGNYYAFVFSVSTTIATTIEEFKNWLKENPITIYYILKEPETIHLTPTKIPLFENENHLTLLEDIETKTDIKYHRIHVFNEAFYTKEETNAQLEIKANEINLGVESNKTELKNGFLEINEKFGNYALQQVLVEQINSVLQKITDSEARINILNQTIANGVPITKTETGYTFDINGLNISSTDAEVNSTLSSLGLSILDNISKEVLLYAGYDKDLQETIVKARNMIIEKYFTVAHCRIEEFKDPDLGIGTGFFYVD